MKSTAAFVLGLIGSIIAVIVFFISLVWGLLLGSIGFITLIFGGGSAIIFGALGVLLSLMSAIIGFAGITQLRSGSRGGVLLIIAGCLGVMHIMLSGWFAVFSAALLLTAGILALVKKA